MAVRAPRGRGAGAAGSVPGSRGESCARAPRGAEASRAPRRGEEVTFNRLFGLF